MQDLESLSATQVCESIASGSATAVIPFGSIEHQDAHLPVGADALVADAVGRKWQPGSMRSWLRSSELDSRREPLRVATTRLSETVPKCVVCAPRGDLGPRPGAHSGEWLTSVMLALRPDLVHLEQAAPELAVEVAQATAARGREHLEKFVASVVAQVREASR
jgi:creatinine amidohydrolase/Fe(II)-dependent formamide hydrolase-like protein